MNLRYPFVLSAAGFLLFSGPASAAAPNPPTNFTVRMLGPAKIQLDWSDNSTDEAGFEVLLREGLTGDFVSLGRTAANVTSVPLTGTQAGATYQLQIRAVSASTPTENSAIAGPVTVIMPTTSESGVTGQAFSLRIDPNTPAAGVKYTSTSLPAGFTLNESTGTLSGTSSTAGFLKVPVTITYPGGLTASWAVTFLSLAGPVSKSPLTAPPPLLRGQAPVTVPLTPAFEDPDVTSAARMSTDEGVMNFAFYPDKAPKTVANFLGYAERGDFVNTFFHRSVPGFIVQGGAFRADATASTVTTKPAVVNEPAITNVRSTVAMAKLGNDPNSATNQFFVNLNDNSSNLDNQNGGFTVFARVTGTGMSVADAIAALPTKNYASVNSALTDTPVRAATAPSTFDPSLLVRISSVSVIAPLSFTASSADPAIAGAAVIGTDLTITPSAAGETTVTVTATDLDGLTVNSTFPVTVIENSYENWAARQSFASPADAAATADPDGDGRLNFVEFALGSEPLVKAQNDPVPGLDNGSPTLTFQLRKNTTGVTVTLQKATDLNGPWTDEWTGTNGLTGPWISGTSDSGEVVIVTAKDPSPPAAGGREFLRLKISQ